MKNVSCVSAEYNWNGIVSFRNMVENCLQTAFERSINNRRSADLYSWLIDNRGRLLKRCYCKGPTQNNKLLLVVFGMNSLKLNH